MSKEVQIIIAMGSNSEAKHHIDLAKEYLTTLFKTVTFSRTKWTDPLECGADKFLNCLATTRSSHSLKLITQALRSIERKCGDTIRGRKTGTVKLDLDILCYGEEILHEQDWERSYIKELMKEIGYEL